jgi:hypothetical protein
VASILSVIVHVDRQSDEFLPVNNPVPGKEQKEPKKGAASDKYNDQKGGPNPPWNSDGVEKELRQELHRAKKKTNKHRKQDQSVVAQHNAEITESFTEAGGRFFVGTLRLLEEEEDAEKHQEDAGGRHAKDIFDAQVLVYPGGDKRAERAADIHQRVVDRIADGADIFLGSARGGAHNAGFHQSNSQGGKQQNGGHEEPQRDSFADRSKPGWRDRADQEIRARENQVGKGESAPEPEFVGDGAAKNGQEPDHAAEETCQGSCLFGGKAQFALEIEREGRKCAVVREALENFTDVGDPEGALEAVANFLEALGETHARRW